MLVDRTWFLCEVKPAILFLKNISIDIFFMSFLLSKMYYIRIYPIPLNIPVTKLIQSIRTPLVVMKLIVWNILREANIGNQRNNLWNLK